MNFWAWLAVAAILVLGYVLVMHALVQQSRESDKHIDYGKMRPWQDDE